MTFTFMRNYQRYACSTYKSENCTTNIACNVTLRNGVTPRKIWNCIYPSRKRNPDPTPNPIPNLTLPLPLTPHGGFFPGGFFPDTNWYILYTELRRHAIIGACQNI